MRKRETADEVVTDALREMGVALGHHDTAVAEPLLDLAQRHAAHGGVTDTLARLDALVSRAAKS